MDFEWNKRLELVLVYCTLCFINQGITLEFPKCNTN